MEVFHFFVKNLYISFGVQSMVNAIIDTRCLNSFGVPLNNAQANKCAIDLQMIAL